MITETGDVACDRCGQVLRVGDFPFCPHHQGVAAIEQDEIPGGVVVENYGPHPMRFDSHSERKAYMKAHGLVEREKFCPMPGTDIDPQGIPNPKGYMDPQTLENARVLLSRNGATADPEWDPRAAGVLVGEFEGTMTDKDARAIEHGDVRKMARLGQRIKRMIDA